MAEKPVGAFMGMMLALGCILIILKATDMIQMSWVWVTSPIWITFCLAKLLLGIWLVIFLIMGIGYEMGREGALEPVLITSYEEMENEDAD
jgi:hypothetical protein